MANKDEDEPTNIGRREMMKRVGVAGAAVAVPAVDLAIPAQAQRTRKPRPFAKRSKR